MKLKCDKVLLEITEITRGRISTPQTFSDFLHYCALLLSARTDPVHTEQRSKALRQQKTSYKDDEWEAFHQSFIELCGTFSRNSGRS